MLTMTVILNCARFPSTLQVFEAANAARIITSYVRCPIFNISILGKVILSFLRPHLTSEEFVFLELDSEEATYLVTTFSDAVASPCLRSEGSSVEELLQFLVNFTRPSGKDLVDNKSEKGCTPSQFSLDYSKRKELTHRNIQSIVALQILPPIEKLLSRSGDVCSLAIEKCLHLTWNLLHSNSAVEVFPPSLREHLPSLISTCPAAESLVLCIQWLLGVVNKNGELHACVLTCTSGYIRRTYTVHQDCCSVQ